MIKNKQKIPLILLVSSLVLFGCGGSGTGSPGENEGKQDKKPTIMLLTQSRQQHYQQDLSLWAEASDDGTIVSYEWKDEEGKVVGDKALLTLSAPLPIGEKTYTITVTDNTGQTSSQHVKVDIVTGDMPVISLPDHIKQVFSKDLVVFADVKGANEISVFEWKDALGNIVGDKPLLTLPAPFSVGEHAYTLSVTDSAGQTSSKSIQVSIVANNNIAPVISLADQIEQSFNKDLVVFAEVDSDNDITRYEWQDATGKEVGDKALLTIAAPLSIGESTYTLTVTDSAGQTSSKSIQVLISANKAPVISLPKKIEQAANKDISIFAEVTSANTISSYEWKDSKGNVVGKKALLYVAAPHSVGSDTYTLSVKDEANQVSSQSVEVTIIDAKYSSEENGIAVYVKNMPSESYVLSQMNDTKFNALSERDKYRVADKLLSSLFFGYDKSSLKKKVDSGTFISDLHKQMQAYTNDMADVEFKIHDKDRYYQSERRPDVTVLSRFFEMKKLDRNYVDHWVAYILSQTILFSPAAELDSVASSDAFGVYNRLYKFQSEDVGMRYATFKHMQSNENWRRFRSPEDNGREMLEIYALDEDDASVPIAAQALKNWHLSRDKETLIVSLDKNIEPLSLLNGQMKFTSGVDFYASLVKSKAFTTGVTTRLVDFMFFNSDDAKKKDLIDKIAQSKPETWDDILFQIIFSDEYLLHSSRVRSIEETVFALMKKLSYNSYYYTFTSMSDYMKKMGQQSMLYKLGKTTRVPLDDYSFATYQDYLRSRIVRSWSRDAKLSVDPKKVSETKSSAYFMSHFKTYERKGVSSKYFMAEENYQVVEDDPKQTLENYIKYLFQSILYRAPEADELKVLVDQISGVPPQKPQWFFKALVYTNDDPDYQVYIRYAARYNVQYTVFEYMLRLDELYFFQEVK